MTRHGKLLIILPDLALGGGHLMNFRLAYHLNSRGAWTVDVASLFLRNDSQNYDRCFPNVRIIRLSARHWAERMLLPFRLAKLARDYDAVMAGLDLAATNYGFFSAKLAKVPFMAWVHIALAEHMKYVRSPDRWLSLQIYRRIPQIVFPSMGALHSFAQWLGKKPTMSQWHMIENFNEPDDMGADHALPASAEDIFCKPVVLCIARLAPQKALDRLIRAHRWLLEQQFDNHLVILGEGPERESLENYATSLGVHRTVFLPGHVSNVNAWLNRATIFTLCSRYEGLPLVIIEAIKHGVPVVSMDIPTGPREILDDGRAGILTPRDDEEAYRLALARLLGSSTLRNEYARKGRERSHRYSSECIIPLWTALLDDLIAPMTGK